MQITEATIHQLKKEMHARGEDTVSTHVRDKPLEIDETLNVVCADLLKLYAKSINGNGTLGSNPDLHVFTQRMAEYLDKKISFHEFTLATLRLVAREMETSALSSGGFALFLRYTEKTSDFLLIAMLKLKPGAGINEENLELEPTLNIDLGLLNEAARINLTRMADDTEPYLTFVKGRARGSDITEYFRRALACDDYTSSRYHTSQVIKAAEDFINARSDLATQEEKREEIIAMNKRLYECFSDNPDEIVIETIAAAIYPANPNEFKEFVQPKEGNDGYGIDHAFKPDKPTYRKIKRITGKMGTVSIGFDVADVQSGRVSYNPTLNAVVLKDPTDHIKQAIATNVAPQ